MKQPRIREVMSRARDAAATRRRPAPPPPPPSKPLTDDDWGTIRANVSDQLAEPWRSALQRCFAEIVDADPLYRPTNFWQPGVVRLMADLHERGIDTFKSWPSSAFFFYPRYQPAFSYSMVDQVMPTLQQTAPRVPKQWFHNRLVGSTDANRDLDVALAMLDTGQLPIDPTVHGESTVGAPPQRYHPFGPSGPSFGKPYLNYLQIMAAVSRHIDRPLRSVVEIGAGFGVLGEILHQTDRSVQYVDLDIPPLSVIAHYYLSQVFPDQTFLLDRDLDDGSGFELEADGASACLSSWNLPNITGRADLFLNAFSFQEMEPAVVANYAIQIARLETSFVVSLNSRKGKPLAVDHEVGVRDQVTSDWINSTFNDLGYETVARLGRPVAPPQAELLILRRSA